MSKIPLYFIGPAIGLLIFIIGVLISFITGSEVGLISVLGIAFGITLIAEFGVMLSILEEEEKL